MAVEPSAGEVVGRRQWTDDLFSIRIRADFEPFEPGQFARIGLNIGGENVLRPYSFVNAPNEEAHEFYYGIVPGGPLSARLVELQPGDSILYVPKPNGYMVLSEVPEARHLWMLATGTAVGPFVSILKNELVWQRFEKIALAHAVRHAAELAYGDEIKQFLQKGQGRFFYAPFVSREETDFAFSGRVPAALQSGELQERAGMAVSPAESQAMICGNPQMVKDTLEVLQTMGLERNRRRKPGHVTMENYW